jgi:transposase-like protein
MPSKQSLKLKNKDSKAKDKPKKRPADAARREYDDRLTELNKHVRDMMKSKLGDVEAICPTCQSTNAKPLTPRRGLLVGIKPCFKCKACGRTYVSDDDRYRNVWLKYRAVCMVQFGGPEMVESAIKMLHDYGINVDHSEIMRWLHNMPRK